jgi:dolichol kinase
MSVSLANFRSTSSSSLLFLFIIIICCYLFLLISTKRKASVAEIQKNKSRKLNILDIDSLIRINMMLSEIFIFDKEGDNNNEENISSHGNCSEDKSISCILLAWNYVNRLLQLVTYYANMKVGREKYRNYKQKKNDELEEIEQEIKREKKLEKERRIKGIHYFIVFVIIIYL